MFITSFFDFTYVIIYTYCKVDDFMINKISKENKFDIGIISLIITISGIFGFIYEFIFYFFDGGMKFYWCGGNFLPWINIYAIGALMIIFLSYKYIKKPLKVFLISLISTGLLELISGYLIYTLLNKRYWDYNTEILNFGNIGGFVCLRSVLFFGISGLILIYLVLPLCFKIRSMLNKKTFLIMSISIVSIFLIDEIYNLILTKIFDLKSAIEIYKSLGINFM